MSKKILWLPAAFLSMALLAGCNVFTFVGTGSGGGPSGAPPALALSGFVSGLNVPVGFEAPSDSSGRIFIVEQSGAIRVIQNGVLLAGNFLDLSGKIEWGGEKGLLGLAFHPNFSANGRFFVDYTRRDVSGQLQTVIAEYQDSPPSANQALPNERVLLVIDQPFDNHNGGQLAFGPDNFLYIAMGDGGNANDPLGNGQNTNALLGKILRIDVDSTPAAGKQYAIPPDNPFTGGGGAPEVYAYGLRNPWRFSFDRANGRLFAGDVGQDTREEVDLITKGGNFGWNITEGSICRPPATTCNMANLIPPIADYDHSAAGGTSVIGGFVYRGTEIPALAGTYVFGDLSSGHVWGLKQDSTGAWARTVVLDHNRIVSALGEDAAGELYLVDYGDGEVLRLVAAGP